MFAAPLELSDVANVVPGGILNNFLDDYPEKVRRRNTEVRDSVAVLLNNPNQIRSHQNQDYTIMDYFSIPNFKNQEDLKQFCSTHFGINIARKDGLEKINAIYKKACALYTNRYGRKIPDSLEHTVFSNISQMQDFLSSTGEGRLGIYRCDLVKLFFTYGKTIKEDRVSKIKDIHRQIEDKICRPAAFSQRKNVSGSTIMASKFEGNCVGVDFTGFSRYKSVESIVGKEIANTKYNSLDNYKDLHGATFEFDTKNDLLQVLQQYYYADIFMEQELEIKNILSKEEIEECDTITAEFKNVLYTNLKKSEVQENKMREKGTSSKYQELKIKGKMSFTDPTDPNSRNNITGVELKFQLKDNENENGDSFHGVLDAKKRLREISRLSGIIRLRDIIYLTNNFFASLSEELSLKNKDQETYISELIEDFQRKGYMDKNEQEVGNSLKVAFFQMLLSELIPVKRTKNSSKIYFVHKKYTQLSEAGIYPKLEKYDD